MVILFQQCFAKLGQNENIFLHSAFKKAMWLFSARQAFGGPAVLEAYSRDLPVYLIVL